MRKIYFEKSCVLICDADTQTAPESGSIVFPAGEKVDAAALLASFGTSPRPMKIYVPTEDIEQSYRHICAGFKEVTAGGGLVSNGKGECLLIKRNGRWDLPKGHLEEGEDIENCALREVEEETGVRGLELRPLICITDHVYSINGLWHLKHTWWYDMLCTETSELKAQREEGISEAVWVSRPALPAFLANAFPSIQEVFRVAGL